MTEDLGRNGHHPVRREQRPEHVRIADGIRQASCASTPVGSPRSIPIEKTWRVPTPPPVPRISLWCSSALPIASTSGYVDVPAAIEDRAAADLDDVAERKHATVGASVARITSRSSRLSRISRDCT